MPIEFDCPSCGKHYRVADAHAGKRTKCKDCGNPVQVPSAEPAAPQTTGVSDQPLVSGQGKARVSEKPLVSGQGKPRVSSKPLVAGQGKPRTGGGVSPPTRRPYGGEGEFGIIEPKMEVRRLNFVFIAAVAVLMLGMVLPWISVPDDASSAAKAEFGYVSGFQLPFLINGKMSEVRTKAASSLRSRGYKEDQVDAELVAFDSIAATFRSLYALLLIPVLALLGLGDELTAAKKANNRWYLRLLVALSPIIAFVIIVAAFAHTAGIMEATTSSGGSSTPSSSGGDPFEGVGIGFWVVLLGALVAFVSVFTSPKPQLDTVGEAFKPRARPTAPKPAAGASQPGAAPARPKLPGKASLPQRRPPGSS